MRLVAKWAIDLDQRPQLLVNHGDPWDAPASCSKPVRCDLVNLCHYMIGHEEFCLLSKLLLATIVRGEEDST